jgi:hypothetical protein
LKTVFFQEKQENRSVCPENEVNLKPWSAKVNKGNLRYLRKQQMESSLDGVSREKSAYTQKNRTKGSSFSHDRFNPIRFLGADVSG